MSAVREFGLVDDTATPTTVRGSQVAGDEVPTGRPVDRVVTPESTVGADRPGGKPTGVARDAPSDGRVDEVPASRSPWSSVRDREDRRRFAW